MARLRQRSTCKAALPLDVRTLRRENLLRANTAFVCTWTAVLVIVLAVLRTALAPGRDVKMSSVCSVISNTT